MNDSQRLYKAYLDLNLDGSWIGLEQEERGADDLYFCTPVGAQIIGWDNGIHYCFIRGFGETVFCVNPETCCDYYVYPLAENFREFLGLLLATGNVNTMQQIIWWDQAAYEAFRSSPEEMEYAARPEVVRTLNAIRTGLGIEPAERPFERIKAIQKDFPYDRIVFSDEFYEITGLENPKNPE